MWFVQVSGAVSARQGSNGGSVPFVLCGKGQDIDTTSRNSRKSSTNATRISTDALKLFSFPPQYTTSTPATPSLYHKKHFFRQACCAKPPGNPCRKASNARTSVTYCSPSSKLTRCSSSWSVGSDIQPSMGRALSAISIVSRTSKHDTTHHSRIAQGSHTFVENITHGRIIQNHHPRQIRLHSTQILDIRPVPESAMLPIIPSRKILPLPLQIINHGIRVLLHGSREYYQGVPFRDLAQEFVHVGPFVDVVEDGHALDGGRGGVGGGACGGDGVGGGGVVEADFDHVALAHAAAFGHAVD